MAQNFYPRHTLFHAIFLSVLPHAVLLYIVSEPTPSVISPPQHGVDRFLPVVVVERHFIVPSRTRGVGQVLGSTAMLVTPSHSVGWGRGFCWHAKTNHGRKGVTAGGWISIP